MVSLPKTMAAIPPGSTTREFGKAYWDGSEWWAVVRGSPIMARWLDPIQPLQGGNIVVDFTTDGKGLSEALVIGGYTDQPRPSTGTAQEVIPAGTSTQIVFIGEDGVTYTTDRFIGSYSPGDPIYLTWDGAQPTIIGKIQVFVPPPPAPPPPPPPPVITTGSEALLVTASDTWGVGGWGRWAKSIGGGEFVYSGFWAGQTLTGSWFYGAPRPALQGKSIPRIQFRVPARETSAGNYNAPATIHLYAHTSSARPDGDVARVVGPYDVVVDPGFQGGYVDLPLAFAPTLVAGGGISIAGNPYVGFQSRLIDPLAGKLLIDWSA